MSILECVPNVSEARRPEVLDACKRAVSDAGAHLLDLHSDPDHNRSVFTVTGTPDVVAAAMHALADAAVARIDLRAQQGVHPRIGAVDVIPFVPVRGFTMSGCVAVARAFGAAFAARHRVPVFLYEDAATAPHRRRLEDIRRGGLERLAARMHTPQWRPDFGPVEPHPTAGVTVVGARVALIAWNINLATNRLDIATAIARHIRASSGGLPCVKALGLPLDRRRLVQVSMNLTDYRVTSMRTVFEAVTHEATTHGVGIVDTELVGLVPAAALTDADARDLRVHGYDGSQILERRLGLL